MIRSVFLSSVMLATFLLFSNLSFAAVKPVTIEEAVTLKEKLTGQRVSDKTVKATANKNKIIAKKLSAAQLVKLKPAARGLILAREAKDSGNFVLAIKRYNFIMKHFAKTPEAKHALLDKAEIYKIMGLDEQAQFNVRRAQQLTSQSLNPAYVQEKKVLPKKMSTQRSGNSVGK